mgnify:FL=1
MQRMGARAARRAAAATRRNPLTGLNPLQPMSGATANSAQRRSVAIPLRGSIPCNTGACLGHQLAQRRSRNPLTGLNPLQRPGAHHRGAAAPSAATPSRGAIPSSAKAGVGEGDFLKGRNPLTGLNPLQRDTRSALGRAAQRSQSPYGAQSLATRRSSRGGGTSSLVAIPLRGSISCNL